MRYLGRKAELTTVLRSIAGLRAGAAGRGRPRGQRGPAGARGADRGARAARSTRAASSRASREDRLDVTLPGEPPMPVGHLHLITQTRRELEDIFVGMGYRVVEGPEVELDYYNFTALNHPPGHPARMLQDTFYFSDEVLLRTHTSPMQVASMESQEPPIYIIVPGRVYRRDSDATHTPMFHQVEGLAVDEDITLADLQGTLLAVRARDLRRGARGAPAPALLPVHRAERRGRRVVLRLRRQRHAARRLAAIRSARAPGWIEIAGAGMVDPNVFGFVREQGLRPRAGTGLRVRPRHRPHRDAQARRARPAPVVRERPALPGAVLMRVPVAWLREYCDPGPGLDRSSRRCSRMSGTEVERIGHVGVPRGRRQPGACSGSAACARSSPHPDADRLRVCSVELGEDDVRTIVCGAPNVAAGQAVLVALPGAVLPDGTQAARRRSCAGVESERDDPLRDRGAARRRQRRDHGAAGRLRRPAGRPRGTCQLGDDVLELEVTPNRPDCLAVYGVARELHAVDRRAAGAGSLGRGRRADRGGARRRT